MSEHTSVFPFDLVGKLDTLSLPGNDYNVEYDYDEAGRLYEVKHSGMIHQYAYHQNSTLIGSITHISALAESWSETRKYDFLNRLTEIESGDGSDIFHRSGYDYNLSNQRKYQTFADGSYWSYQYDDLGQLEDAKKYSLNDTLVNPLNLTYTFDSIGNRNQSTRDTDVSVYTSNELNQYSEYSVPRSIWIDGSANSNAIVSINGATADRIGEYFYFRLDYNNEPNPDTALYLTFDIEGRITGGGDNGSDAVAVGSSNEYLESNPESFAHDADGNLSSDDRWSYEWNGENRLVAIESSNTALAAGVPKQRLEFSYDNQGRRFEKKVFLWDEDLEAFELVKSQYFIYDSWNMIQERIYDPSSTLIKSTSYVWGIDLSRSLQGAGGVGGLLAVEDSITEGTYSPYFDGNGNVMGYVDLSKGAIVAEYEYNAFGEKISKGGERTTDFNYRFSTKYEDEETGLLYYGYRYYDAELGRWLAKDPIGEFGFVRGTLVSKTGNFLSAPPPVYGSLYANGDPVNILDSTVRATVAVFLLLKNHSPLPEEWLII